MPWRDTSAAGLDPDPDPDPDPLLGILLLCCELLCFNSNFDISALLSSSKGIVLNWNSFTTPSGSFEAAFIRLSFSDSKPNWPGVNAE